MVSIVIPVYNQAALTAQCLEKIVGREIAETIVVDDGSTDSTAEVLAAHGRRVKTLRHDANRGFAQSCNDGAAVSSGEFVVFLNNDTIPQPGWLRALIHYAEAHPEAAAVGARLLYPNNTVQHAGVVICQDRYPRHLYSGFPADQPSVLKSRPFQIVTGACLLVRREVFDSAGGFDIAFQNGFEDVDLCLRLGAKGHQIHYCADSVLYHLESVSPGRFRRNRDNVALYRERWLERVQPDDLHYYLQDQLIRVSYEGRYPIGLEISPLLASLDGSSRSSQLEQILRQQARELAELQRDNTRLCLEIGMRPGDSPELRYRDLRQRIRSTVLAHVAAGSTVLVISKGDGALLELPGCRGWHFPQTAHGAYAGYHPVDSAEAVSHLEKLRCRGAHYLVIPAPYRWWLEEYGDFHQHLESRYLRLPVADDSCVIYALRPFQAPTSNDAFLHDTV